jgi:hypothetical protein
MPPPPLCGGNFDSCLRNCMLINAHCAGHADLHVTAGFMTMQLGATDRRPGHAAVSALATALSAGPLKRLTGLLRDYCEYMFGDEARKDDATLWGRAESMDFDDLDKLVDSAIFQAFRKWRSTKIATYDRIERVTSDIFGGQVHPPPCLATCRSVAT